MHNMDQINVHMDITAPKPFQNNDILQHIISFIGMKQYRFVAAISKDFQAVYRQVFPNDKSTCYNASSIEHAKISLESVYIRLTNSATLCNSAARHGSVPALAYLRSIHFRRDSSTCDTAAKFGHLCTLQYLHSRGCPWSREICCLAARNGHLEVLQWARLNGFS
jgi:hypothetical protein